MGSKWGPSKDVFDPKLTKADWLSIINDREICHENWLHILARYYEYGGEGACSEIEDEYEEQRYSYNIMMQAFAKRIIASGRCEKPDLKDNKNTYWCVIFVGREAQKDEPGIYIWKLRDELSEALEEFDIVSWDQDYLLRELVKRYKTLITKTNNTE